MVTDPKEPFYALNPDGTARNVSLSDYVSQTNGLGDKWRRLRYRTITKDPDIHVSTVCLGIDHGSRIHDGGLPVLWETMVFGGLLDQEGGRYTSQEFALLGHDLRVNLARVAATRAGEAAFKLGGVAALTEIVKAKRK